MNYEDDVWKSNSKLAVRTSSRLWWELFKDDVTCLWEKCSYIMCSFFQKCCTSFWLMRL